MSRLWVPLFVVCLLALFGLLGFMLLMSGKSPFRAGSAATQPETPAWQLSVPAMPDNEASNSTFQGNNTVFSRAVISAKVRGSSATLTFYQYAKVMDTASGRLDRENSVAAVMEVALDPRTGDFRPGAIQGNLTASFRELTLAAQRPEVSPQITDARGSHFMIITFKSTATFGNAGQDSTASVSLAAKKVQLEVKP